MNYFFFLNLFSLKKVAEQGKVDPFSRLESNGKTHFGSRINGLWVVLSWNSYQWLRSPFTLKLHCKLPTIWESCFYQSQWIYEMWASNGETVLIRRKSMRHFSGNWSEWIHSMNVWCLECLSLIRPKYTKMVQILEAGQLRTNCSENRKRKKNQTADRTEKPYEIIS